MSKDAHPCEICLRSRSAMVRMREPLINKEGEHEAKIRPRKIMPYTEAGGMGVPEMVRGVSNPGARKGSICISLNPV